MTTYLLPDAERLAVGFLLAQTEVTSLCGQRIFTVLPAALTVWPTIRLTRWGGRPVIADPLWLDRADLQVDVWADTKLAARDLAETVRAVCAARLVGAYPLGVITAVTFGPFSYRPDDAYAPARPRYVIDLSVLAHPVPVPAP